MFASSFIEASLATNLRIVPVDCTPAVLQLVLDFIYTEKVDIPRHLAIDVILVADMLLIDKLKNKAAKVIVNVLNSPATDAAEEEINVFDVLSVAWRLDLQQLEECSGVYIANRLEDYIDEPEFEEVIRESAGRIQDREATDTIELLDEYVFRATQPLPSLPPPSIESSYILTARQHPNFARPPLPAARRRLDHRPTGRSQPARRAQPTRDTISQRDVGAARWRVREADPNHEWNMGR